MSELADKRRAPPRFPYVAAAFCAACLGAAVWTWMRYSYAWHMTPKELLAYEHRCGYTMHEIRGSLVNRGGLGRYVQVEGDFRETRGLLVAGREGLVRRRVLVARATDELNVVALTSPQGNSQQNVRGRVRWVRHSPAERDGFIQYQSIVVDTTASRFHPASTSGLAVGALGVFVFALYLRNWLKERRAAG